MSKNNEDDFKLIVQNVLNTGDGLKFVQHLLVETGVFNRAVSYDVNKSYYLQGRSSIGEYILELIRICDFESYIEILREK